jgi:hypothetical protein
MMNDDECGAVGERFAMEAKVLGEYLPKCHFAHHKSHMTFSGSYWCLSGGKPVTYCLSYDMATREQI